MRPIPAILSAIAILAALLIGFTVNMFLPRGGPSPENLGGPGIDSGARIEIEGLRQQIENLQERIATLETGLTTLQSRQDQELAPPAPSDTEEVARIGPNAIIDAYAQVVLIANRTQVNRGITVASPRFLEDFLGRPREVLSDDCEPMTNPNLKDLLISKTVGPIQVSMLQPALDSLERVFENIRSTDPDLYARINTAGSLCVRQIRGTVGRTSTHSFGLAVDLNIDGTLDTLGDGKTQLGLTILADFFHEEGWVWGAGFTREDSMHFEVSQKQLEEWRQEGKI